MNDASGSRRIGGCAEEQRKALDRLATVHSTLNGVMGDLSRVIERGTPRVIAVRSYVLDSNGTAADQYRLPFESLSVDSLSGSQLTIMAAPLQGAAPAAGAGIYPIRAGGFAVVNFRAYQWSIYGGNPGDIVAVTAYGTPQSPDTSPGKAASPSGATLSSVAASVTSVPLFAAAPSVNGRAVFNDSSSLLYLAFAATASTTAYTVQVAANSYYELPQPTYAGAVSGIWTTATGNARLTSW